MGRLQQAASLEFRPAHYPTRGRDGLAATAPDKLEDGFDLRAITLREG